LRQDEVVRRLKPLLRKCRDKSNAGSPKPHYKVEPEIVAELYRKWVMPLNKEVQIQYLLRRLEAP
jgi:hypothetical protein